MYTAAITAAGGTISLSGTVTQPLASRWRPLPSAPSRPARAIAAGAIVASVQPAPSGAFTAKLNLPAGLQKAAAVYLRAETKVRKVIASKKTFATFTLIRGIRIG